MSFHDSLSRFKGKLKKKLHIGSRNPTPTPSSPGLSGTPADAPPPAIHRPASPSDLLNSTLLQMNTANKTIPTLSNTDLPETSTSAQPGLTHPDSTPIPDDTSQPGDGSSHQPQKTSTAWSGATTLLAILESSVDAFGPLKSAIGGLARSFDIYERATKGHTDNQELLTKLKQVIDDLRECITGPVGLEMTNSVKLVCTELAEEVQQVEEKLEQTKIRQLAQAMDASNDISECYHRIQSHLERLTLNATMNVLKKVNEQGKAIEEQTRIQHKQEMELRLKGMSPALTATFNSSASDEVMRGECTPGTRLAQIKFLLQWANNPKSGKTCWMNGMAGTGKTTIAYSVCSQLSESFRLGASFFCSRTISECRQVKNIIPSIAYQLARFSLPFRHALDKVLASDPDAHTRAIQIQHKQLILEPLSIAQNALPADLIVVIDALDECENENSLAQVLDVLLSTADTLPIRFLVSSRPEPEIYHRMMERVEADSGARLVLHDLAESAVRSDIETYMKYELPAAHFPLSESQWTGLITQCGVLFIYASTACRFIKQETGMITLNEAVKMIINPTDMSSSESESDSAIDELYSMILTSAFKKIKANQTKQRMRSLLETVICAVEPMALATLAKVLQLEGVEQAQALLQPLRSVINLTGTGIVTTLHASFPDYMLSSDRSKELRCVAANRHTMLADRCLEIIEDVKPKFNICSLSSSYLSDDQVEDIEERVSRNIPPSLIYACRYWSTHLYLGEVRHELVAVVERFFSKRLLLWMEILNLTKHMRFGTGIVRDAERWCQKAGVPSELTGLVRDAGHFVSVYANHAISESTPHIYVSMLAFWPRSGPVSVAYVPKAAGILNPTGTAIARRQPALLATWRLSSAVYSMALSPDGTQIVAATDNAIDMLDTSTGDGVFHLQKSSTAGIQALAFSPSGDQLAFGSEEGLYLLDVKNEVTRRISQPDSGIYSVVFSPSGSHYAFGLSDGTICLYASQTGELVLGPLDGHTDSVNTLAFSPSGDSIASGSYGMTVQVWDVTSGHMIGCALEGHTSYVSSVSYSPDGTRIASASADRTIRVWSPLTGITTLGPLTEHSAWVQSVTFSPNGAFIASGSADKTIRVYDAQTGQTVLGPLHGHTDYVRSVIFSPDSTQLYSCSSDGTIRVWNVQDLVPTISQPAFPSTFLCVRYSPDDLRVVSGSRDGSVCIWDVKTGDIVLGPLQSHSEAVPAVDFSPDGAYIVSASSDCTLRVWSAQDGSDIHGPIQGHTDWVCCVRFSPDGVYLVSGSDDRTVRIWDVATGQPTLEPFTGHHRRVSSVAFSPNGALVASGSWDDTIRLWDINTGQTVIDPLQGHESTVSSVEFSPDGSHIISGSWNGSIRLWDTQTGQSLLSWGNNHTSINSISFSPDGLLVVSGSDDSTTQIWDAQTGELLHSLYGHVSSAMSTQFSPDGLHIVSCSYDGAIRFWDVDNRIANQRSNSSKEPGRAHVFIDSTLDPWSLDEKGWITDQQQQRLVWVPEDLRVGLLRYPNDVVICRQGSLKLSFDGVNIGKKWTECYSP